MPIEGPALKTERKIQNPASSEPQKRPFLGDRFGPPDCMYNSWAVINTWILITAHELKILCWKLSTNFEIMLTRRFISKFTFETLKLKVRHFLIMLTPLTDSWWSLSISVWSKGNFNWSHVQLVYWFSLKKQRAKYVRIATWLRVDLSNNCAGDARFGIGLIPRGHVAQCF